MSWTDERVEMLKKLWSDGLSASQIAAELGGVTRNAVIGKVHRLGLSGRAKSPGSPSTIRPKRISRGGGYSTRISRKQKALVNSGHKISGAAYLAENPVIDLVAPEPLKLTLVQLTERTCKWPIGDPAEEDFHFCGHGCDENGPYCSYHARLAYQPIADRRRVAKAANGS